MILKCAQLVCLDSLTLFPHRSTSTIAANIFPQLQIFSSIFDGWNNIDIMKSSFLIPESFFNNSTYNAKIINISFWLSEILNLCERCLGWVKRLPRLRSSIRSEDDCLQDVNSERSHPLSLARKSNVCAFANKFREANFKLNLLLYIALELFSSGEKSISHNLALLH